VYASEGSVIQWGAPLSGSDSVLYIKTPGTYTCTVTSCGITTSLPFTISVSYPVAKISSNQPHVFCADTTAILTANSGMAGYLWLPVNVAGPTYTVSASGTYTLIATDSSGCKAQDTMSFDVTPNNIPAPLVPDTSMCPYEWVTLSATGKPTLSWYLSPLGGTPLATGSTYTTPVLDSDAVYYVQSAYGGCVSPMQEVKVNMDDCNGIYIPNVFTPNGDGKDDVWFVSILGAKCFQANIYNRWGQLVFQSNDAHIGWDGIIHQTGRKASDGVYYYIVNYCNYKNEQKSADGFLQLLRNQ
jgi:gliding motility-associated-like protein